MVEIDRTQYDAKIKLSSKIDIVKKIAHYYGFGFKEPSRSYGPITYELFINSVKVGRINETEKSIEIFYIECLHKAEQVSNDLNKNDIEINKIKVL